MSPRVWQSLHARPAAGASVGDCCDAARYGCPVQEAVDARALLAGILYGRGEYDEAASIYLDILSFYDESDDQDRRRLASLLNNVGNALAGLGRLEEAIPHYRRSLAIRQTVVGVLG